MARASKEESFTCGEMVRNVRSGAGSMRLSGLWWYKSLSCLRASCRRRGFPGDSQVSAEVKGRRGTQSDAEEGGLCLPWKEHRWSWFRESACGMWGGGGGPGTGKMDDRGAFR